ncbi:hypothetical protein Zmor_000701 [Zophobas morio]|uniref:Uncharacterized protein n=1 Tax=Zophobas morio TaxID=2755281 RepID=A0AA38J1S9_9CUCU|nr:hypothetical protein Zmor_000701 [Zophobas morio]
MYALAANPMSANSIAVLIKAESSRSGGNRPSWGPLCTAKLFSVPSAQNRDCAIDLVLLRARYGRLQVQRRRTYRENAIFYWGKMVISLDGIVGPT